ncbi:related to Coiled-coil domain-containing protein 12 (CCDC12) [Serendipita indica DSM 11827]|uniref:Related to Coiled-coil domain-containing protein 12 (CCDC12) n=1 Tax=Serendipita indica (strain DSM 11827) TaxID=1109443 RepID=G4TC13_SERID|nr:related to Coiled-coil domain-containing protein 12 (CCDC12) [Serendipita indica DSM 11827]
MSLAEEVEARKARLQALRAKKAGLSNGQEKAAIDVLSQRNFDPETRTLKRPDVQANTDTVEKAVEGLAKDILEADKQRQNAELDIMNIAPKRANWDLKRDLNKKLVPLERATREAIYTLVRARLKADSNDTSKDLANAMDARAAAEGSSSEDDE